MLLLLLVLCKAVYIASGLVSIVLVFHLEILLSDLCINFCV